MKPVDENCLMMPVLWFCDYDEKFKRGIYFGIGNADDSLYPEKIIKMVVCQETIWPAKLRSDIPYVAHLPLVCGF